MSEETINRLIVAIRRAAMLEYIKRGYVKTEGTYRRQVWNAMRDLFSGNTDEFEFIDDFNSYIDNQFTRAWNAGAREMGVNPSQFTDADITALADLMSAEQGYMLQLADDILGAKNSGLTLDQFRAQFGGRADMWANRYNEIQSLARVHFGGKRMLIWVYGGTEDHCADCEALEGTVATAEDWAAYPLKPQSRALECHGYNCQCSLVPTDQPPSGKIPK